MASRKGSLHRPRNILFITADQWRGVSVRALFQPVVKTPNIGALAREGTLFARHFSTGRRSTGARKTEIERLLPTYNWHGQRNWERSQ